MNKILIIEDQPDMRENLALTLRMEGFEALTAADGESGLARVRLDAPDVVLCDVMMPGLDGYGVLRAVRDDAATADLPFIFLTARGEKKDHRLGITLGADDYLTKPVLVDDLLSAIQARLARRPSARPVTASTSSG
jgi:DNA-binding response OmpR family regulator